MKSIKNLTRMTYATTAFQGWRLAESIDDKLQSAWRTTLAQASSIGFQHSVYPASICHVTRFDFDLAAESVDGGPADGPGVQQRIAADEAA
jgi:hypothetical protein